MTTRVLGEGLVSIDGAEWGTTRYVTERSALAGSVSAVNLADWRRRDLVTPRVHRNRRGHREAWWPMARLVEIEHGTRTQPRSGRKRTN